MTQGIIPMYLTPPADGYPWTSWELHRFAGRQIIFEAPGAVGGTERLVGTIAHTTITDSGGAQFLIRVPGDPLASMEIPHPGH